MSLRFFADHCVSNAVILALQEMGFETFRLREHIPADSPDGTVISKAQELDAILVTLNGDFADIVTYPPRNYKRIIALQIRNHPEITPQIIERLHEHLSIHTSMSDFMGKLLLVEPHRIRVRR